MTIIDTAMQRNEVMDEDQEMPQRPQVPFPPRRLSAMQQLRRQSRLSVDGMINFGIPANADAQLHAHETHGRESWQVKVLKFLHRHEVQMALLILLLLDVVILFTELFLLAHYPTCHVVERDAISCCSNEDSGGDALRFLASDSHGDLCEDPLLAEAPDNDATCDPHKWETVHTIEEVLFFITITILTIFLIELLAAIAALTPSVFFRQFFYALDFFIISVSLAFEITFHYIDEDTAQSLVGLLVLFRIWRFVRIGHGLIEVTHEVTSHKYERLLAYTEELEELLMRHEIDLPDSETRREIHQDESQLLQKIQKEIRQEHHAHKSGRSADGKHPSAIKENHEEEDNEEETNQ